MGTVFGWGYFGIFIGSVRFRHVGDRYGRKTGAVLGVLAYSVPALLTPMATSLGGSDDLPFSGRHRDRRRHTQHDPLLTETAPKRFASARSWRGFALFARQRDQRPGRRLAYADFGWPIVFVVAESPARS